MKADLQAEFLQIHILFIRTYHKNLISIKYPI